jgi:Tfp pilus assembly protein PilF
LAEGLVTGEAVLRLKKVRVGEAARDISVAYGNLGLRLANIGRLDEAQDKLDQSLALEKRYRPLGADMAGSMIQRAGLEQRRAMDHRAADLIQAERWIEAARALLERLLGAESEEVANCWNALGDLRRLQGRGVEAVAHYERGWTLLRALAKPNLMTLANSAMITGANLLKAGDAARAEARLREAHNIYAQILAERSEHAERRNSARWLIACLYTLAQSGDDPEARRAEAADLCQDYGLDPADREAEAARRFGPGSPDTG